VEKVIEVAKLATEMEGSEFGESSNEIENLLGCLIGFDSERGSNTVGERSCLETREREL
jgi:hypothetical protein